MNVNLLSMGGEFSGFRCICLRRIGDSSDFRDTTARDGFHPIPPDPSHTKKAQARLCHRQPPSFSGTSLVRDRVDHSFTIAFMKLSGR